MCYLATSVSNSTTNFKTSVQTFRIREGIPYIKFSYLNMYAQCLC